MALSSNAKRRLSVALASLPVGEEVSAAIDSMGSGPAAAVTPLGVTANLPASACAGAATPTAANVNDAVDALKTASEARLDAIESRVDAMIAALTAAALMA